MTAKKRAAPRKALPIEWNLEQLDEEMRVALGLAKRPGISRYGATPQVVALRRPKVGVRRKKGADPVLEDVPWTEAQQATIYDTMAAHVANPLWGEKQDAQAIRLILTDADFDGYLTGAPTAAETVKVVRKLVRATRALARIARNEAT